jgi:antitoxin HicB
MSDTEYRFTVRPLTEEEGGGYLIEFPDLPGCISDGETIEESIANGEDAQRGWIAAMREAGRPIPPPSVEPTKSYSGKMAAARSEMAASPTGRARQARRGEPEHSCRHSACRRSRRTHRTGAVKYPIFSPGSQKPHFARDGVACILGLQQDKVHGIWVPGPGSHGCKNADVIGHRRSKIAALPFIHGAKSTQ